MMAAKHVSRWGAEAQKNEENNKFEGTREDNVNVIDIGSGDLCFDGFEIDWLMGCLDSDQENKKMMNLEGTGSVTEDNFSVIDCGVDGVQEFDDELGGGDLYSDDFDIDWIMGCLDLDQEEGLVEDNTISKTGKGKFSQELDEFGGGLCFDDLSDFDFDVDWFLRCLDSDQEKEPIEDIIVCKLGKRIFELEDNSYRNKRTLMDSGVGNNLEGLTGNLVVIDGDVGDLSVAAQSNNGVQELDELCGGVCFDDLSGGDLCSDDLGVFDIDWLMRCLDSNQEEEPVEDSTIDKLDRRKFKAEFGGGFCSDDLGDFNIDWFVQLLDSNQEEEPVEHSNIRKLGKRRFEAEENSYPTKKMCL